MVNLKVYNLKGALTGEVEFPKNLEAKWNPSLVHQVAESMLANQRKPSAHTKGRGEVRGGGKKPWAQKGTGRSRHGSIRSPLWKGGGTTFGPSKERNFQKKINKKMARLAFLSVLSKKAAEGELKVIESFDLQNHKTKPLAAALKKIVDRHSAVLVAPADNRNLLLASRNLPKIQSVTPENLNVRNLLNYQDVLLDKSVISFYVKKYGE